MHPLELFLLFEEGRGGLEAASLLRQNTCNLKALQAALGIPSVSKFQAQPTRHTDNKAFVAVSYTHLTLPTICSV